MAEQWATCIYNGEVYDGYEVSTDGQVRSLNYRGSGKVKILKPTKNKKTGYLTVSLSKNNRDNRLYIHRLVAFAFIENDDPINKTEVNHISEDKTLNTVENLQWCTRKQNIHHGTCIERRAKTMTGRGKRVLCVETGVIYDNAYDVKRKTGLSHGNISKACNGKLKTVGGYHWKFIE